MYYERLYITDNTGWNAANRVFGQTLKHLLCHWHVHRYNAMPFNYINHRNYNYIYVHKIIIEYD